MFKNNSVKIKITEQRLREYVLIFSISVSFGIWVRAYVFSSTIYSWYQWNIWWKYMDNSGHYIHLTQAENAWKCNTYI